jgi:hypothetical protein
MSIEVLSKSEELQKESQIYNDNLDITKKGVRLRETERVAHKAVNKYKNKRGLTGSNIFLIGDAPFWNMDKE